MTVTGITGYRVSTLFSENRTYFSRSCSRACLHSSGPEDHGDDVDHRCEAGIGLFVARGDASERLDGAEEVFDEVAPLVFFRVMRGVSSGSLAQRDDSLDASARQARAQPAGIESLVADEGQAGDAGHENVMGSAQRSFWRAPSFPY